MRNHALVNRRASADHASFTCVDTVTVRDTVFKRMSVATRIQIPVKCREHDIQKVFSLAPFIVLLTYLLRCNSIYRHVLLPYSPIQALSTPLTVFGSGLS